MFVPTEPPALLLGKLPAGKRDFSSLPIQVFLVPAPAKGEVVTGRLPEIAPLSTDFTNKRLGLNPDPTADVFVRVEYPRKSLVAGVDIVAERTAQAANGEKITTQTRCRISAADAAVWR